MIDPKVTYELDRANKLIFVKAYDEAWDIFESLCEGEEFGENYLIQLRFIELAVKMDRIDELVLRYKNFSKSFPNNSFYQVMSVMTEQHRDLSTSRSAILRYQKIIEAQGELASAYYGLGLAFEYESDLEKAKSFYEKCLSLDYNWFPAYLGLSQINYQLGNPKEGDRLFFQFEKFAKYNVYGNFDTHRELSLEFMQEGQFEYAQTAINSLVQWWEDHKGVCPVEIKIFQSFALSYISYYKGDEDAYDSHRNHGKSLVDSVINRPSPEEGILFFIAKVLEEYNELNLSISIYRKILDLGNISSSQIQKIGSQFISTGEYNLAKTFFDEAYLRYPDDLDIRFSRLVANLKLDNVDLDSYLRDKDQLKIFLDKDSISTESLQLVMSLMAQYDKDPDVFAIAFDLFMGMGHVEKAETYLAKLLDQDGESASTKLKALSFYIQQENFEKIDTLISKLDKLDESSPLFTDYVWLKANYYTNTDDYSEALKVCNKLLACDPWNISYLVLKCLSIANLIEDKINFSAVDKNILLLAKNEDKSLTWHDYDSLTLALDEGKFYELAYNRQKIRFLFSEGSTDNLLKLVEVGRKFNPIEVSGDMLKLLNTNFDGAQIYWALGMLFKEQGQFQTASMWFEQVIRLDGTEHNLLSEAYLELADSYNWQGLEQSKAVEYVKLALDLAEKRSARYIRTLAHSCLLNGHVRQAQVYLEDLSDDDPEVLYLKGLVEYRNGSQEQANKIWKPLLTYRAESLKLYKIKQELLKYYFDKEAYNRIN